MPTAIITILEAVFTALLKLTQTFFPEKSIISSKAFMKLPMDNKGKVVDNYLFNLKLIVKNRIKTVMSCCIDLHYLLYYRYDLHCGMSGD